MFMALKGHGRLLAAGLALSAAAVAFPASASAAPQTTTKSGSAQPMTNYCWRTSAIPGSTFIDSFDSCSGCHDEANWKALWDGNTYYFYCTYNPSNGLFDLQRIPW
ncbi:hypothetical protein ABT095_04445 [Kitasatospora sp. NPDC002227]|uniref:hypothetical protein n=1 Tax=Kitasatospora sp. NPDC002227 TaxID=3154773 RepID=UPI00332B2F86